MRCVQRRACPRPLHLNLFPTSTPPLINYHSEAQLTVQAIDQHLARYGHQISTLDFAEPTLAEDPLPVMLNLKAVVQDTDHDPAATQIDLARRRQAALREAKQAFSDEDWRELCDFLWLMKRVYPDRDQALFYLGAGWPTLRRLALELGRRLAEAGTLTQPDDVFYLWRAQLEEAMAARQAGQALPELKGTCRRTARTSAGAHAAWCHRTRCHRKKVSGPGWGKTANDADSDSLNGNACSPGQITARASLVMSPADFAKMLPGTILVCPMTTPAWTQLFSQARGLVTDIGSILTHGSIVAREYNIPAVLGLGIATKRIKARAADPCGWRQRCGRSPRRVRVWGYHRRFPEKRRFDQFKFKTGRKSMKILVTNDDGIDSPSGAATIPNRQRKTNAGPNG